MKLKSTFLATTSLLAASTALAADVEVYGQVNKLVVSVDNNVSSSTDIVDNDASSTRFGFKVKQQLENGMVASALLELQTESNSSNALDASGDDQNESQNSSISERHSRVGLSGNFGTILIGKTSEATDGVAEVDLGGVSDVMYSDITSTAGATAFTDNGTSTGVKMSKLYSNFDGGRTNLVRYDTPIVNGVQGSVSVSSGSDVAVAAKYKATHAGFNVAAAVGYQNLNSADNATADKKYTGSASVKHEATGLAATVATGMGDYTNGDEGKFYYTKLSYLPNESKFEYAVEYAKSSLDQDAASKNELESYGAGVQYNLAKGVSTSVMYRQMSAEIDSSSTSDIDVMSAGLKVKF
jgi:predicted porin